MDLTPHVIFRYLRYKTNVNLKINISLDFQNKYMYLKLVYHENIIQGVEISNTIKDKKWDLTLI